MLRHIKNCHCNIEAVGDQHYCHKGLENPFEKVEIATINKQDKDESNDLEFVVKTLCRGGNKAVVDNNGNDYDCTLYFDETMLKIALNRLFEWINNTEHENSAKSGGEM